MDKPPKLIGYGHPPVEHRFQPGKSGNPTGRPKGARRFIADLLDELAEIVAVNNGDQKRALTKQRAIVSVLVCKALEGRRARDHDHHQCVRPRTWRAVRRR